MDSLPQGTGQLFTDPSANQARESFAKKPRALTDKVTTVADAVARLLHDGDYLAIGGFRTERSPPPVLHEILPPGQHNLRPARHTPPHHFPLPRAADLAGPQTPAPRAPR